jgi:hypothetical protein
MFDDLLFISLPIQICAEYLRALGKKETTDRADRTDSLWTLDVNTRSGRITRCREFENWEFDFESLRL